MSCPERFGRAIERDEEQDFPFYNGVPVALEPWRWVLILSGCAVGFLALVLSPLSSNAAAIFPRMLFPFIALSVLVALSKGGWRQLFARPSGRDVVTMVGFWLVTVAVSAAVGWIVVTTLGPTANPAALSRPDTPAEWVTFFLGTAAQLFGEELFTILPFLACLSLLYALRLNRRAAIVVSWLVTAVLLGAAHLPTYTENVLPPLLVVSSARLVLTLAYIRTKNVLVSTGAHILNDWTSLTLAFLTAAR